jgi:hypothetical protein
MSNKSDFGAVQAEKNKHAGPSWKVIIDFTLLVAVAFLFFALRYPFSP